MPGSALRPKKWVQDDQLSCTREGLKAGSLARVRLVYGKRLILRMTVPAGLAKNRCVVKCGRQDFVLAVQIGLILC